MTVGQVLKDWWKQVGAGVAVIGLIVKVYPLLTGWAEKWLAGHCLSPSGAPCTGYQFTGSGTVAIGMLVLLLAASLLAYTLYAYSKLKKKATADEGRLAALDATLNARDGEIANLKSSVSSQEIEGLKRTFKETMEATDLIAKQLFPAQPKVMKTILSFKGVLTIGENGNCHVHETFVLTAKDYDIHFMEKTINAAPDGEAALFPDEIGLKIVSRTPSKDVVGLISQNDPLEKSFVIFFLPFLQKGRVDKREVAVTYYWKGFFRKLATKKEDDFESSMLSSDPIPSIEYQFWLGPGLGKVLKCSNVGSRLVGPLSNERLEEVNDAEKGQTYWKYAASNVPSDHVTHLKLELKD